MVYCELKKQVEVTCLIKGNFLIVFYDIEKYEEFINTSESDYDIDRLNESRNWSEQSRNEVKIKCTYQTPVNSSDNDEKPCYEMNRSHKEKIRDKSLWETKIFYRNRP